MLGHLIVESRDNESKQEMYESEFNLIVIYLIEQEENEKRTNEGKEKYCQISIDTKDVR